jgi:hypothetical protein
VRSRTKAVLAVAATALASVMAPGIAAAATPGPQGSLDSVSLTGVSGVQVRGWVSDGTAPTGVAVYVDGTGYTLTATDTRPDVQAHLGSGQSGYGFNHVVPVPAGQHRVCAYALSQHGAANPLLGCRSITAPSDPIGHVDSAVEVCTISLSEQVRITGWVFDPDRRGGPGIVDAYVHSAVFSSTVGTRNTTTIERSDVAAAYGLSGDVVGFSIDVGMKYGFDTVRLYGINTDGAGSNPLFATISTANLAPPTGC